MNEPRGYLGRCTVSTDAATAEQNTHTMSHWSSLGRAACNMERSSHQRRSRYAPIVNQNRRLEPFQRYDHPELMRLRPLTGLSSGKHE